MLDEYKCVSQPGKPGEKSLKEFDTAVLFHPDWDKFSEFHGELLSQEAILRLKDTLLKSMDVAFVICNYAILDSGPHHFQAILADILPTAFALNLAIWPFLRREDGSNLCICDQYRMDCHHIRKLTANDLHCLNIEWHRSCLPKTLAEKFPRHNKYLKPFKYGAEVFTVPLTLSPGFLLSMKIKLRAPSIVKTANRLKPTYQDSNIHLRLAVRGEEYGKHEEFEFEIPEDFKNALIRIVYFEAQHMRLFDHAEMGKKKYKWSLFPWDVNQNNNSSQLKAKDIHMKGKTVLRTGLCPSISGKSATEGTEASKEDRRKKRLEVLKQLQDIICRFLRGEVKSLVK